MKRKRQASRILVIALLMLVAAPLAGGVATGLPAAFFEFPPLTQYVDHAPLSLPILIAFALIFLLFLVFTARPRWFGFRKPENPKPDDSSSALRHPSFPPWGWFGLILNVLAWTVAWTRPDWLGPLRDHMFFPLWFGYILTLDGLVHWRTGRSMISTDLKRFIALFPASALAWWYFEYLNRFVQNWWYEGVTKFSALEYALFATLCFSTVLPAVFESRDFLMSFRWFRAAYANGPAVKPLPRIAVRVVTVAGAVGLILLAMLPNPMFFMTWLAPLALLAGGLALAGHRTCFSPVARGDYSELMALAFAALLCGFFWEMWNFWSLPKWHYTVPYVNAAHVFEMPVVGYAGYLPFGPICWCMWEAIRGVSEYRGIGVSE